jgi:hypothetical protein
MLQHVIRVAREVDQHGRGQGDSPLPRLDRRQTLGDEDLNALDDRQREQNDPTEPNSFLRMTAS